MRIGMVVNRLASERPHFTTTHLAMAAVARGHEVVYIEPGHFELGIDDRVSALGRAVPRRHFRRGDVLLRELLDASTLRPQMLVGDLDVLMLRNNPNEDVARRPWARMSPIDFGALAAHEGVMVVNDPRTLARSLTKLYLQEFPREVRPDTLVTRNRERAKEFIDSHAGRAVFKPLFGYGGHNVFLVRPEDGPNVNQMFEAVAEDGYVIVQEYLPDAVAGDTRLFLLDGRPLVARGRVAAVARRRTTGEPDMRSNLTAGASAGPADVDDAMLQLAERIGPKLQQDNVYFAGVDIVGSKVMEINIMTPGALYRAEEVEGVKFHDAMIENLERRVAYTAGSPPVA